MAISPPSERNWWSIPIHKVELYWIILAFCWGLVMFFMMIFWHGAGKQNLSNEAYRIEPAAFFAKAQAMVDQYTVRDEAGVPVVHPPPGSDVYIVARLWSFWPILELEKDQSYRFHLSSMDWQHGFSLQPVNINLQIHPGYDIVFSMTPTDTGEFGVICNEFCGIGHHNMVGKLLVVD
jgi:cytochrome c oxidase subunit 2